MGVLGKVWQLIFWNSHNREGGEILAYLGSRKEMRFYLPKIGSFLSLQKTYLYMLFKSHVKFGHERTPKSLLTGAYRSLVFIRIVKVCSHLGMFHVWFPSSFCFTVHQRHNGS